MRRIPKRIAAYSTVSVFVIITLMHKGFLTPQTAVAEASTNTTPAPASCQTFQGNFLDTTAQSMLADLGVSVYPQDHISAFPDPSLGVGAKITWCPTPSYTIIDGHASETVRSWAVTTQQLLDEQRVSLGDQDEITPARDTTLASGESVVITRVAKTTVTVSVPLSFSVQHVDDPTLDKGTQQVKQAGQQGVRQDTYLDIRKNGVLASHIEISSTITKQPVPEIIADGTKVVMLDSGLASWYQGVGAMTAAHRTLPLGTMVTVTNTANGKSVVVRIADRGPFVAGRVIDLSEDAFAAIGSLGSGVMHVTITKN